MRNGKKSEKSIVGNLVNSNAPEDLFGVEKPVETDLTSIGELCPSVPANLASVGISEDVQASVEKLVEQKDLTTAAEDIQELNQQAQRRAAQKTMALETLTLIYESGGDFGELKETVEAHKERCRAARQRSQAAAQDLFNQKMSELINKIKGSTQ